jgi:hypothetical protein
MYASAYAFEWNRAAARPIALSALMEIRTMPQANATTDHATIRRWAESRRGHPAVVKGTKGKQGGGLLRIDFDPPEDSLEEVSWDEFFDTFDRNHLAFLYQDETSSGDKSRFAKFVDRDTVKASDRDEDEEEEEAEEEEEEESEEDEDEDWDEDEEEEEEEEEEDEDEEDDDKR